VRVSGSYRRAAVAADDGWTCNGFGATDKGLPTKRTPKGTLEGAWFVHTGNGRSFSEQQLIDCAWDEVGDSARWHVAQPAAQTAPGLGLPLIPARGQTLLPPNPKPPQRQPQPQGSKGCDGGDPIDAIDYVAKKGGIAQTQDYPYRGLNGYCRSEGGKRESRGFWSAAPRPRPLWGVLPPCWRVAPAQLAAR
jgi:cathepsin L